MAAYLGGDAGHHPAQFTGFAFPCVAQDQRRDAGGAGGVRRRFKRVLGTGDDARLAAGQPRIARFQGFPTAAFQMGTQ